MVDASPIRPVSVQSTAQLAADHVPQLQVLATVPVPVRPATGAHDGHVDAHMVSFEPQIGGEHVAVLVGAWQRDEAPLVRVHSECLTGDVFGSARCDCGPQLDEALRRMASRGGIILYLRQEGRGIGLYNKLNAYRLQDEGLDTYEANRALDLAEDARDFRIAAAMLAALDVRRCRLLSNNPEKREQLEAAGIEVVEQVPTGVYLTPVNRPYLEAKVRRARHQIRLPLSADGRAARSAQEAADVIHLRAAALSEDT